MAQLHFSDYRRAQDVPAGDVLVVGGGNSAVQIAVELAATHTVTVAAPRELWFLPVSLLGVDLYWWSYLAGVLTADRESRASRYVRRRGDAVVARELRELIRSGAVRLLPHRGRGRRRQDRAPRRWPVCTGWASVADPLNSSIIDGEDRDALALAARIGKGSLTRR